MFAAWLVLACSSLAGCDTEDGEHGHDTEIISRVELHLSPVGGGETMIVAFTDPDGDGGSSGSADVLVLSEGTEYELELVLLNELAQPVVDISDEVAAEAEEHFVFFLGEGVAGPASATPTGLVRHAYADLESDYGANEVGEDLPLGLLDTLTAEKAGTGTLRVILRHLPPLNGVAQKTATLPEELAAGEALPGEVDVDVSFELRVE